MACQHGGGDELSNLALACDRCNAYKGANLTSIDQDAVEVAPRFHPRTDVWEESFRMENGLIHGLAPSGRATVRLLNMNAARRVQLRQLITS